MNLVLATLSPDNNVQSDISFVSSHVPSVRKGSSKRKSSSKCNIKSTSRAKKCAVPANPPISNTFQKRNTEETNQKNRTHDRVENNIPAIVKTPVHDVLENQVEPERSRLFTISPVSTTTSTTCKRISESHRRLVKSVFSSITKRKSTNDSEDPCEEQAVNVDFNESVSCSPPRPQMTKKARLVFQKCFQNTFDPRMLPGHDTILAEDSDENNSD